jgi:hypothetical protein
LGMVRDALGMKGEKVGRTSGFRQMGLTLCAGRSKVLPVRR